MLIFHNSVKKQNHRLRPIPDPSKHAPSITDPRPGVPWGALPDPPGDGLTVGFWWIYHDLSSGIDI